MRAIIILFLGLVLVPAISFSATIDKTISKSDNVSKIKIPAIPSYLPSNISQVLRNANTNLKNMELIISETETSKLITKSSSENLNKTMYSYAENIKSAFDIALQEAEIASISKGTKGNVKSLSFFEEFCTAHKERLRIFDQKTQVIKNDISIGKILLDEAFIRQMSPSERIEFKKELTPQGLKKYPINLFKAKEVSLNPINKSFDKILSLTLHYCSKFFIGNAEAASALACISPCLNKDWNKCVTCVRDRVPQGIQHWNSFVNCWNSCGWKWWCKSACLLSFVIKIA